MQFTMGCYKHEHCLICDAHISEIHKEGCELGAAYTDVKDLRIVIKQFLMFLGSETITDGLAKLAAQHRVHADLKPACPTCQDTGSVEYPCPNCRSSKTASSG